MQSGIPFIIDIPGIGRGKKKEKVEHFAKGHAMNSHLQALLEMFEVIKTNDN